MAGSIDLTTDTVVVEEQVSFTLSALCQACGAQQELVHGLVVEGVLHPTGQDPQEWQFSGEALPRARRALRLVRDFELDLAAVGLVMDLLGEIDRLRAQLGRP